MSNTSDNTPIQVIEADFSTPKSEPTNNQSNVNSFTQSEIEDGRTLGVLVHLLGMFTSFFGPLIIYAITVNPLVKMHAKNALNFQISLLIYFIISGVFTIVLIGLLGLLACTIFGFIFPIIATIKASDTISEDYKYPTTIQFLT